MVVRRRFSVVAAVLGAPAAITLSLAWGFDAGAHEGRQELIHRLDGFAGAATCARCHPDHHASWARTFHATMTQRPSADTVAGAFDGRKVRFYGKEARLYREAGRFLMDLPAENDGPRRVATVALAVGSRRYQQYFEKVRRGAGFVYRRLPLLWHIGARRWLHLNGVFLGWDDPSWYKHAALWNQNCIFCHNTAPRPGYLPRSDPREIIPQGRRAFDSRVATLGIGCESCHGPGHEHVARMEDLAARYGAHLGSDPDVAIVDPKELDQERRVAVCGQCHGQRIPKPLARHYEWRRSGPTYRSGDRLADHVTPVQVDTRLPGDSEEVFRLRFWGDGTPRLTAYEYQGITMSACYRQGQMTCNSCHTMHGGDVHGQIEPAMRGDRACLQCHGDIGRDVPGHTKHGAGSSGSRCLECHMPRIVYGILDVHRSHHIENPDPRRDAEAGRPNACTLCHLDRSPLWAADRMKELWGGRYERPRSRPDKAPLSLPDSIASLLAGDAVERVVWARQAGRQDAALAPEDKAFLRVLLIVTLLDAYPAIRWTAQKALLALERELPVGLAGALRSWNHEGDKPLREQAARAFFERLAVLGRGRLRAPPAACLVGPDLRPDLAGILRLLGLQSKRAIAIGE